MIEQKHSEPQVVASQDFLSKTAPLALLPEKFRLDMDTRLSLINIWKLMESLPVQNNRPETEPREIIAAAYVDGKDKIRIRDIRAGSETSVSLKLTDLTQAPHWDIASYLSLVNPEEPELFLVPPDYKWPYLKSLNKIVLGGKKILGFIHTHPNGWPPSPLDVSGFLQMDSGVSLMGVIGNDTLFLLVKTKETKMITTNLMKDIDDKTYKNYARIGNFWYAVTKELKEKCIENNVGLYIGSISKNEFPKVK